VIETANILGFLSALALLAAVVSWAKLVHARGFWGLDNQLAANPRAELASQLLVLTFVLGAVAAALALVGHFAP